jgi:hypothetical protein
MRSIIREAGFRLALAIGGICLAVQGIREMRDQ